MNPAAFALRNRSVMILFTILIIGAGILAYQKLGRLEDPNFVIKIALIITRYPGAGPREVEEQVTDVLEEAIQSMGQLDEVYSTSEEGVSYIYVELKDTYTSDKLPQIWDELRKKVEDARESLPDGAGKPSVIDDFSDVYGVFFALTGPGYTYAELKDYADELKKELLRCEDVAKIAFWGLRKEVIYIEFGRAQLAQLGLTPEQIYSTLQLQNVVQASGKIEIDGDYIRISPTGDFTSEDLIENMLIGGPDGLIRLGDVAHVYRGYEDPPKNGMRYDGKQAIGLGVSTVAGGNVIGMGTAIKAKLNELAASRPIGMELHTINFQSDNVNEAVNMFVMNLVEAVLIVIILLMVFMGWQSGLLIGVILLLTILATFIGMLLMGIDLQKISLGALILALGMLVDNAIVVADGILVKVEKGESREQAAREIVRDTRWPLLGATIVAILAFAAIGYAPGNVGEFCRSLFYVLALSLLLSWVLAVTITPLFCVWFLRIPDVHDIDPYDSRMFRVYRRVLHMCLRHRWLTGIVTIVLLLSAVFAFRFVPNSFFPDSTRRQFFVDYWLPQGTHITRTAHDMVEIEKFLMAQKGVKAVTSLIGEGGMRFILGYDYVVPNSSYGQFIVEVDDYRNIDRLIPIVEEYVRAEYPDAEPHCKKFPNGPSVAFKVEARFRGPDTDVLQHLAEEAMAIMKDNPNARDIRTDWRQQARVVQPVFSEAKARRVGVTRNNVGQALQWACNGLKVGQYREQDELIQIISRPLESERGRIDSMNNILVWSPLLSTFVPIQQVVDDIKTTWEYPMIQRRDRVHAITVKCNPVTGLADTLLKEMRPRIDAIPLPNGYTLKWCGEYEGSEKAQAPLKIAFPLCLVAMFTIVVCLFNSFRTPIIIFLTVPLSIIGVTAGLLIFRMPFGFMAILGFLGLSGMLIKNAIVLIDQINLDLQAGKPAYKAVLDSSVSRLRPVLMAAGTTILGMTPLVLDPFYNGMAVTIMGGLAAGTFLTLIIVPVQYSIFYRIRPDSAHV